MITTLAGLGMIGAALAAGGDVHSKRADQILLKAEELLSNIDRAESCFDRGKTLMKIGGLIAAAYSEAEFAEEIPEGGRFLGRDFLISEIKLRSDEFKDEFEFYLNTCLKKSRKR